MRQAFQTNSLEDGIDHAVLRVENIEEDHAHCSVGDDIRDHVCRTDKFPAARLFVQHKRQDNADGDMNNTVDQNPDDRVAARLPEGRIAEQLCIILQTDECHRVTRQPVIKQRGNKHDHQRNSIDQQEQCDSRKQEHRQPALFTFHKAVSFLIARKKLIFLRLPPIRAAARMK